MRNWSSAQWPKLSAAVICRFMLLLESFCPRRHDAIHARVGNRLAQMFAEVPCDCDEGAAYCGLAIEHFLRLVCVGVVKSENRSAKIRERILQGLQDLRLVSGDGRDGLEIQASWKWCSQCPGDAIVCLDDMGIGRLCI